MSESTELEVIEDAEYAPVERAHGTLFGTDDPAAVIERAAGVADGLASVVRKQGLCSVIQGKEYPRVEAWTLLGSMLGVFPVVVWSREVGDNAGWEARVEARTRDGALVGAAEAECLRSERTWSKRDSYALRSMAQTRATSKALRGPLGFVMTLAGFEATPESEMPAPEPVRTDGHEPERGVKSWAAWEASMMALEVPRPLDWLQAAADASGLTARGVKGWGKELSQRAERVRLFLADNPPASAVGFYSVPEIQAAWAHGFDGVVVLLPEPAPEPDDGPEFAPHLPLVEEAEGDA